MNKKLCVYAICKNESKFIDRWVGALQDEADCVVVLDTGSTDDSVEKLNKYSPFVTVKQYDYFKEIGHFRFDTARNDSLKLIPNDADICVVLDLDQVPRKGWSSVIRERFDQGYTEVTGDIVDHDPDTGLELNRWRSRNVHPNSRFWIWTRIIHEGIEYYGNEENNIIYDDRFVIDHYPDEHKDRNLYLSLLKYACETYPKDPYYGIYLGIELYRRYSKEEATVAFRRCIDECVFKDTDNDKRLKYQSLLNLALCTEDAEEAIDALTDAESIGIKTRRLYKIFADVYEKIGETDNAMNCLHKALTIPTNSNSWEDDYMLFNGYIEDRLSLFYYYQKNDYLKAIEYCCKALEYNNTDERVNNNLKFYVEKYFESRGI